MLLPMTFSTNRNYVELMFQVISKRMMIMLSWFRTKMASKRTGFRQFSGCNSVCNCCQCVYETGMFFLNSFNAFKLLCYAYLALAIFASINFGMFCFMVFTFCVTNLAVSLIAILAFFGLIEVCYWLDNLTDTAFFSGHFVSPNNNKVQFIRNYNTFNQKYNQKINKIMR